MVYLWRHDVYALAGGVAYLYMTGFVLAGGIV